MEDTAVVTEEFKPQFRAIGLRSDYMKAFFGVFVEGRRIVKTTRRTFRTASDAQRYAAVVLSRYRRLLDARILTMATIEQK